MRRRADRARDANVRLVSEGRLLFAALIVAARSPGDATSSVGFVAQPPEISGASIASARARSSEAADRAWPSK